MTGGLVHLPDGSTDRYSGAGGQFHTMVQPDVPGPGGNSSRTAGAASQPGVAGAVDSRLDSFFRRSTLTREDVLVIGAVVQMLAWMLLLYLEVTE